MNRLHMPDNTRPLELLRPVESAFSIAPVEEATQSDQDLSKQPDLKCELIIAQKQLEAALQKIEQLELIQSELRMKLVRLANKFINMRRFVYRDKLTGLPNRSLLMDRLKQAIAQATRQNKQLALLFIDLDKFKDINDTLGHSAGDTLLQLVAKRLSSCIRYCDTACRYGGDEFVILLPEIAGQDNAEAVTEKIHSLLHKPYVIEGHIVRLTLSIGSSVCLPAGQNGSDLIDQADRAMYRIKKTNKNSSTQEAFQKSRQSTQGLLWLSQFVAHSLIRLKNHNRVFEKQSLP